MAVTHDERFPYTSELELPVIGLEAEFKVFVDDVEIVPEEKWRTPAGFIDRPLIRRTNKSMQLPTGGALYFDGGVIEVVTPVIEIAPQCTARVVRSLWEQIGFVREQFDRNQAQLRANRADRLGPDDQSLQLDGVLCQDEALTECTPIPPTTLLRTVQLIRD